MISDRGLDLIKSFEGYRAKAYKCLPSEKYYTIGYGHYGSDVKEGDIITPSEALELLRNDVKKFEKKVDKYSKYNFNQNQYDALVSFCYNIGNIDQLTQKGTRTIAEISDAFLLYNKANGTVLQGLVKRRKKEKELFDTPIDEYYMKVDNSMTSIVDALKLLGEPSDYTARKKIAIANGVTRYTGLGSQNVYLLNLLKAGKLKRV